MFPAIPLLSSRNKKIDLNNADTDVFFNLKDPLCQTSCRL